MTGRSYASSNLVADIDNHNSEDLNKYCDALVNMVADSVPDVRIYLEELSA